jgi:hypothetical protein
MRKLITLLTALASIAFAVCSPAAAQMTLTGAGCAKASCGSSGPPTFTAQGNFGSGGNATQTTATLTIGATGPQVVAFGLTQLQPGSYLFPITSPTISTGGTCNVYQSGGGATNETTAFIVCVTSGTGTATITYNFANDPFGSAPGYVWTAPSSGFVSTVPTGNNNQAASGTAVTVGSISTSLGGTCLFISGNVAAVGSPTIAYTGTLGGATTNARIAGVSGSNNFAAADTIGNSISTSASQTIIDTWGTGGALSTSAICFR